LEAIFKVVLIIEMNVYAHTWRKSLLGTSSDIYELRTIKFATPNIGELPLDEINRDLKRTFPRDPFFLNHIEKIRNVLLWYAHTNTALTYCQCFSFLSFVMYKTFWQNDKRHAMIDTYYCMHKMILIIKPLLPKLSNDSGPLKFAQTLESVIYLDIMKEDRELYLRLKGSPIVKIVIFSGVSCYFLNWFGSENAAVLLNYIIDKQASTMFQRLLHFTVAFFLVQKSIFMGFEDEKCLELLHEKEIINFYSVLWKAKSLNLSP
jgi:hypothetical protein